MITLDFSQLSYIDFEDLCRDIASKETKKRFEAFGPGPDGGIDGRHSKGDQTIILQAKHYHGSTFSKLKSAIKTEAKKVSKLSFGRYIFYTSQSLTPDKKKKLFDAADIPQLELDDIWGKEDLEAALRRYPEIVKSHVKLWLSNAAVLEKLLSSGLEAYINITKDEILEELRVYVRNPSFDNAFQKLEQNQVVIVSGMPGVGKTTLAKMLSYQYLKDDWNFVAIRSLDDGFKKIDEENPTVFYFDDFLGLSELNRQSLLQNDSALASFVRRIRNRKNARFILTTRAHIFEEARNISDRIDDDAIQLSKFILDVGYYTREIKTHILFNHVFASNLTDSHFEELLDGDHLVRIIDHDNYNPRIVAAVSSALLIDHKPEDYPSYVLNALNNPQLVWEKPYKNLDQRNKNLLISLFFCSEYGVSIGELRETFSALHPIVSEYFSQPRNPGDFDEALRSLESGFIQISGKYVSFVNPGIRDFLKTQLADLEVLKLLPSAAVNNSWAQEVWRYFKNLGGTVNEGRREYSARFVGFLDQVGSSPTVIREKMENYPNYYTTKHYDLCLVDRLDFLVDLWEASEKREFLDKIEWLCTDGELELIPDSDGPKFPELIYRLRDHYLEQVDDIIEKLELKFINVLRDGLYLEDVVQIVENVQMYLDEPSANVQSELEELVKEQFAVGDFDAVSELSTEDELETHIEHIENLAKLTGNDSAAVHGRVEERLMEISTDFDEIDSPDITESRNKQVDAEFSDEQIKSLFGTLIH